MSVDCTMLPVFLARRSEACPVGGRWVGGAQTGRDLCISICSRFKLTFTFNNNKTLQTSTWIPARFPKDSRPRELPPSAAIPAPALFWPGYLAASDAMPLPPAALDKTGKTPILTYRSSAPSAPRPRPIRGLEELVERDDSPTLPLEKYSHPWPGSARATREQHCELLRLLHINQERYQANKYVNEPIQEFREEPNLVPKPLFYDPEDRQLFVRPVHERTPARLERLRKALQHASSAPTSDVSHEQNVHSTELSTSAVGDASSVGLRGGFVHVLTDDVSPNAPLDTLEPAVRGYSHRRSLSSPQKAFSPLSPVKEIPSIPRKPLRIPTRTSSLTKSPNSPAIPRKLLPTPTRRSPKNFAVTPRRSLSTGAPILSPTRFQGSPHAASHWASPTTPDLLKRSESRGAVLDRPLSFRRGLLWDNLSPAQNQGLDRTGSTSRRADSFSNVSLQKPPATDLGMRGDLLVPPAEEPRARIASKGSVDGMQGLGLRPSSRCNGIVNFKKYNLGSYKDPRPDSVSRIPKSMLKAPITEMVKEGWFKPNDIWIYARRVQGPNEEIYIYKEMPVRWSVR